MSVTSTFDMAIISQLSSLVIDQQGPTITDAKLVIHEVHSVLDDADMLFNERAKSILLSIYGDNVVFDTQDIVAGQYAAISTSPSRIDITAAYDTTVIGWVSNSTMSVKRNVGHITWQQVAVALPELKQNFAAIKLEYAARMETYGIELQRVLEQNKSAADNTRRILETRIADLGAAAELDAEELMDQRTIIDDLRSQLSAEQEILAQRTSEYKRLVRENISLRETDNTNTDTIIRLTDEIGRLREKITTIVARPATKFDYKAGVHCISEDTRSALPTRAKPAEAASIPDPGYDACISQLKAFDFKSLLSRDARDVVISRRSSRSG